MLAIIETGGKQYPVSPGEAIRVEKLEGDIGAAVEFTKVVAVTQDDGKLLTGTGIGAAKVTGTIAAQGRAKKIIVFKFKKRKHYRRRKGHRQDYTDIKVGDIIL
jgi:large subunit ribosomal protein L21